MLERAKRDDIGVIGVIGVAGVVGGLGVFDRSWIVEHAGNVGVLGGDSLDRQRRVDGALF